MPTLVLKDMIDNANVRIIELVNDLLDSTDTANHAMRRWLRSPTSENERAHREARDAYNESYGRLEGAMSIFESVFPLEAVAEDEPYANLATAWIGRMKENWKSLLLATGDHVAMARAKRALEDLPLGQPN